MSTEIQKSKIDKKTDLALVEKDISKEVLDKINKYEGYGEIHLPKNYSAENALKAAWLYIQDLADKDGKPALKVCARASVATALFKMASNGLSIIKKQCYFIVYDGQLSYQDSYFGNIARAKRTAGLVDWNGSVVYEGDSKNFKYEIDLDTGAKRIIAHPQDIKNIDVNKITGAYAIAIFDDGRKKTEVMSMVQIRESWSFGFARGKSKAHIKTPDQMAIRTVINRLLKPEINSSDDSDLDINREGQKEPIREIETINLENNSDMSGGNEIEVTTIYMPGDDKSTNEKQVEEKAEDKTKTPDF